jgi:hypothetical protein
MTSFTPLAGTRHEPAFTTDEYRFQAWLESLAETAEQERRAAAEYDPTLPAANLD